MLIMCDICGAKSNKTDYTVSQGDVLYVEIGMKNYRSQQIIISSVLLPFLWISIYSLGYVTIQNELVD